jgi:hypothetical protein
LTAYDPAADAEKSYLAAIEAKRGKLTYAGGKTTDEECIWYSPACLGKRQSDLFGEAA